MPRLSEDGEDLSIAIWHMVSVHAGEALAPTDEGAIWAQINARAANLARRAAATVDHERATAWFERGALAQWCDDPDLATLDLPAVASTFASEVAKGVEADAADAHAALELLNAAKRARLKRAGLPYKIQALELDPLLARARDRVRAFLSAGGTGRGLLAWAALAVVARRPMPRNLDALIADAKQNAAERGGGRAKIASAVVAAVSGEGAAKIEKLPAAHE